MTRSLSAHGGGLGRGKHILCASDMCARAIDGSAYAAVYDSSGRLAEAAGTVSQSAPSTSPCIPIR